MLEEFATVEELKNKEYRIITFNQPEQANSNYTITFKQALDDYLKDNPCNYCLVLPDISPLRLIPQLKLFGIKYLKIKGKKLALVPGNKETSQAIKKRSYDYLFETFSSKEDYLLELLFKDRPSDESREDYLRSLLQ